MKKKIIKSFILLLITFIFIPNVLAEECSNSELMHIRNLASAIKFEIKYIGKQFDDEYGIYISNLSDELYIMNDMNDYHNGSLIDGLKSKQTYKLYVYPKENYACIYKLNYSRDITMPAYNKYYKSDICLNNSEIYYCEITYDSFGLSEEQFNETVNKYLDSQNQKPVLIEDNNNLFIYIIVVSFLFVAILIITIFSKRRKKAYF